MQWTRSLTAPEGELEVHRDAVWLFTGTTLARHDDAGATEWTLPVSKLQVAPNGDLLTLENLALPSTAHVLNRRSKTDPTVVLSSIVSSPANEITLIGHRVDANGRIAIAGNVWYNSAAWTVATLGPFALPQPNGNGIYSSSEAFVVVFAEDESPLYPMRVRAYEMGTTTPVTSLRSFEWSPLGSFFVTGTLHGYPTIDLWVSGQMSGFPGPFTANIGAPQPLL